MDGMHVATACTMGECWQCRGYERSPLNASPYLWPKADLHKWLGCIGGDWPAERWKPAQGNRVIVYEYYKGERTDSTMGPTCQKQPVSASLLHPVVLPGLGRLSPGSSCRQMRPVQHTGGKNRPAARLWGLTVHDADGDNAATMEQMLRMVSVIHHLAVGACEQKCVSSMLEIAVRCHDKKFWNANFNTELTVALWRSAR